MNHRHIYFLGFILVLSLFCCKKKETKTMPIETLPSEIINTIEESKNNNRDIFENLFSDIPADYNEYQNKLGYEIVEIFPDDYLQPKKVITIVNECYSVTYWPGYNEDGTADIFVRQAVDINKKTDECILGNYIGENIEILLKNYDNAIKGIYEYEPYTYYSYGYGKNKNSFRSVNVGMTVVGNMIIEISYGYAM